LQVAYPHSGSSCVPDSWSNWNLEMLIFEERGKPEYREKNLSEQGKEPKTNLTHIWHRRRELDPGHTGRRRVLSLVRHPCSPCSPFLVVHRSNVAGHTAELVVCASVLKLAEFETLAKKKKV